MLLLEFARKEGSVTGKDKNTQKSIWLSIGDRGLLRGLGGKTGKEKRLVSIIVTITFLSCSLSFINYGYILKYS